MDLVKSKKCTATKADGSQCHGFAIANSEYCYFHDPDFKEKRIESSRAGGLSGSSPKMAIEVSDRNINSFDDLLEISKDMLQQINNQGFGGKNVSLVGRLLGVMTAALSHKERIGRTTTATESAVSNNENNIQNQFKRRHGEIFGDILANKDSRRKVLNFLELIESAALNNNLLGDHDRN